MYIRVPSVYDARRIRLTCGAVSVAVWRVKYDLICGSYFINRKICSFFIPPDIYYARISLQALWWVPVACVFRSSLPCSVHLHEVLG